MNAQVYDLVILDSKSGIVGVQVNDITQDAEGYIWVATNGGVSRYDGKNFVNYVRRDGLAENNCTAIFCDSENRVWVGHQTGGVSIIFPDSIQRISEENGLANNEVHDIFQDDKDNIWVATFGGVSKFDGSTWNAELSIKSAYSAATCSPCFSTRAVIWPSGFLIFASVLTAI